MKRILFSFLSILVVTKVLVLMSGCAQIISPTGGKRDTIPPVLLLARPPLRTTNFTGNRIVLNFDEYIVLDQVRDNLLVSPTPNNDPYVDYKLKTVTIKIRDTLQPNTTYAIDMGNAIRDNNENNILKRFRYVFSTGSYIDSLTFSGKVQIAETGKSDSTLQVYLYKNLDDSAVNKQKPRYIARLDSSGRFAFKNLAPGLYHVYALKDGDGQKTYNSKSEMFAFADSPININSTDTSVNFSLYAFQEEKETPRPVKAVANTEKKLKYAIKVPADKQDILSDLVIEFNKPLKKFDSLKISLTDTLFNSTNANISLDSTLKRIIVHNKWKPESSYDLIISKDLGSDSTGLVLAKTDTIRFKTKSEIEYGSIKIDFTNFNKARNPVLQFIKSDLVVNSYPLTSASWSALLFDPAEYELRILYDENNNGYWDPGNYGKKIQPERVYFLPKKLNLKANWDNEIGIELPKNL